MKSPGTYEFSLDALNIEPGQLTRVMGYDESNPLPEPVAAIITDVLREAPPLCDIRGGYVITEGVKANRQHNTLHTGEITFHTEQIVTHQLRNSEAAAWFLCTVGEALSNETVRLMKEGDLLKGYVVDVLANVAVDLAMDRIQDDLKEKAGSNGWHITNRYSPGYCGWDITEQQKLFSLLPEGFMGVGLTGSSLMQPIKSVSGVIGLGPDVRFNNYTCNLCDMEHCLYRNRKI